MYGDVVAPFDGELCNCHELEGDHAGVNHDKLYDGAGPVRSALLGRKQAGTRDL